MPQPAQPGAVQLAQRLRDLREQVGLTQAALAKALSCEQRVSPVTVSSWESFVAPKLAPRHRLLAYARFFATHRSVKEDPPRLLPLDDLTDDEQNEYEKLEAELLALRDAAGRPPLRHDVAATRSWRFSDPGPITLICAQLPKAETSSVGGLTDPNYTELQSYADLDALVELHGHIRAENSATDVFFKLSSEVVSDDLSGHVVLLGGSAWNELTLRLSEMSSVPVRRVDDPAVTAGEIFVADVDGTPKQFLPKWAKDDNLLEEDVGLTVRTPNPLNSKRTLTICNGIHSRGVLGAVRALTDARLRESNERYIAENFEDPSNFAILMRVPVISGKAMTPDFYAPDSVLYRWPATYAECSRGDP